MAVPDGCPLSGRQFEVLTLLAEGLTQQQVAQRLGLAQSTVRTYASDAFEALGCSNTVQAITVMGRNGWIGWEPPEDSTPFAIKHPFLAAYLHEFERSRWPHEPDPRSVLGMRLALAGHRNSNPSDRRE